MRPRAPRALRRLLGLPEPTPFLESDRIALDPALDLTAAELAANANAIERWRTGGPHAIRTLLWLVPPFEHATYGGIHTILRFADRFARAHDVRTTFAVHGGTPGQELAVAERIAAAFPGLAGARVVPAAVAAVEAPDAAIATFWPTAFVLARLDAGAKFLFLQDRESLFYAVGAASALAEQALALGFPAVVNSPALAGVAPAEATVFTPTVDRELFHPPATRPADRPVRVFFYARPSASRNAFGLGLATLREVKARFGDRVELLAAGEAWHPRRYGLAEGIVTNVGLLDDLAEVAALYRSCDVGLFFMMTPHASYQPLELMACGAACVSNDSTTTRWLLEHDRTALLTRPLPSLVADAVGRLVDDPVLRERLGAAGRRRVLELPHWDDEIDRVWRALTRGA